MRRRSDQTETWDELRGKIIGLGEQSSRKSYYPELMARLAELEDTKKSLAEVNAFLQAVIDSASEMSIITTDLSGIITLFSRGAEKLLGYGAEEMIGRTTPLIFHRADEVAAYAEEINAAYDRTLIGFPALVERVNREGSDKQEWTYLCKDQRQVQVELVITAIRENGQLSGYLGIAEDISERKRAEEEKQKLQDQLVLAQKMESVGRLAGGVAHDFNNMLGVILGNAELALKKIDPMHPLVKNLEGIRQSAERSADLTRQLLAFARKQTVAPKVLDLNETIARSLMLLRRLVGEDVDIAWIPGRDLWQVKIDPTQIDQILMNLTANARDAIAGVGKVSIETKNATVDEAYCTAYDDIEPGEYVILAVSDNGSGMDRETMANIFEPFFTTKERGKGTGLGLATVYGIVKQNSGIINVHSEPGEGALFSIYLPRYTGKTSLDVTQPPKESATGGTETVLLVEDESILLELTQTMLETLGYLVLTANTPGEAIRLAAEHTGEIHLLLTDVVMPEMSGLDLAKQLLSLRSNLKHLFMSGYTANLIAHHGILEEGVFFIQKPFFMNDLAAKIREVLSCPG